MISLYKTSNITLAVQKDSLEPPPWGQDKCKLTRFTKGDIASRFTGYEGMVYEGLKEDTECALQTMKRSLLQRTRAGQAKNTHHIVS